jgi:hypothetical protein
VGTCCRGGISWHFDMLDGVGGVLKHQRIKSEGRLLIALIIVVSVAFIGECIKYIIINNLSQFFLLDQT